MCGILKQISDVIAVLSIFCINLTKFLFIDLFNSFMTEAVII